MLHKISYYRVGTSTGGELSEQNMTENAKNVIFGTNKEDYNWVASRGADVCNGYVCFGFGIVNSGGAGGLGMLFYSVGGERSVYSGLRPVVSLTSVIPAKVGT